jgi:hypothetical protein
MEKPSAVKFVNDFHIELSKLRIKAFGLFHTCALKCFDKITNEEPKKCLSSCELSKYFSDIQSLSP